MPPRYHAQAAERGFSLLLQACAADSSCAARYPNPAADLERALALLDAQTRDMYLEKIRTLLYRSETAREVPSILQKGASGDLHLLANAKSDRRFGAYRLRRQHDACRDWPIAASDPRLLATPRSNVAVLFISGALDPVSPPEWAAETAARFPAGRQIVVSQGAHVLDGMSGIDTYLDRVVPLFVEKGSVLGIDLSCFAVMQSGPFH
jgi:pimeloyl-ACP methyl ester carboxylesterase